MTAKLQNSDVTAPCPNCGAPTTFEHQARGDEFGSLIVGGGPIIDGHGSRRTIYRLLRCSSCGRGGLSAVAETPFHVALIEFFPRAAENAKLPDGTPKGVVAEFREAERCAAVAAWRAGSALLRSALEKTLKLNGYDHGKLVVNIEKAAEDGVITAARKQRAHDEVRVLGNDVLHDEWRKVTEEEYEAARHYTQRIVEDFYDHRAEVESVLRAKGRIPPATAPAAK